MLVAAVQGEMHSPDRARPISLNTRRMLRIEAHTRNLAALRDFVEEAAVSLGVAPGLAFDVVLAVDEAAANIILHGYRQQPGMIEVQVERQGQALIVRLQDDAPLFDPNDVPPPDLSLPLERRPPGKLGIHLMRKSVNEIIHQATLQGGNQLTLVKHLEPIQK
jgi:serine/threonine-protein kinase RsbW